MSWSATARARAQAHGRATQQAAARQHAEKLRPIFNELAGVTNESAAVLLNEKGVKTLKDKKWYAMSVLRIRKQLGLSERHKLGGQGPRVKITGEIVEAFRSVFFELVDLSCEDAAIKLNGRGLTTPLGRPWNTQAVSRIRKRLGMNRPRGNYGSGGNYGFGGNYGSRGREIAIRAQEDRANIKAIELAPIIMEIRAGGVSTMNGIARELNKRGIATNRWGKWEVKTVKKMIARFERISATLP
jgi:hypothetical protein